MYQAVLGLITALILFASPAFAQQQVALSNADLRYAIGNVLVIEVDHQYLWSIAGCRRFDGCTKCEADWCIIHLAEMSLLRHELTHARLYFQGDPFWMEHRGWY